MNLNRQFFIMPLMILSTIAYGKENLPMMTVSLEKGSISAIIYQGAPQKDILASLKKAHQISEKQAEKSVVMEGIYHIMIQNQSAIQIFSVQSWKTKQQAGRKPYGKGITKEPKRKQVFQS